MLEMQWWEFWIWITASGGFNYWWGWRAREARRDKEHPYKWRCMEDDCAFKCESNDIGTLDHYVNDHEAMHRENSG